jgi:hypothetical protein
MRMSMLRETIINKVWSTSFGEIVSTHKAIITWFDKERFDMLQSGKFYSFRNVQIGENF